jgi:hypothetical protein
MTVTAIILSLAPILWEASIGSERNENYCCSNCRWRDYVHNPRSDSCAGLFHAAQTQDYETGSFRSGNRDISCLQLVCRVSSNTTLGARLVSALFVISGVNYFFSEGAVPPGTVPSNVRISPFRPTAQPS